MYKIPHQVRAVIFLENITADKNKPSKKLVTGIVTSVKTHQSLNKYKISVRNNDGNRQFDQFRHNGRKMRFMLYKKGEKLWAVFNRPLQIWNSW
jgi:hypothetical protein